MVAIGICFAIDVEAFDGFYKDCVFRFVLQKSCIELKYIITVGPE